MRAAGIDSLSKDLPSHHLHSRAKFVAGCLAVVAAASMWFYVGRILIGHQLEDAAAYEHPRGNLSDLYPRWLGARELLLHHRNPYSDAITSEIQQGYYGRALDSSRPNDPTDQQGFAYPLYVVFVLAPVIGLPFPVVHALFYCLLGLLSAATVLLWLRVLDWRLTLWGMTISLALTLGSFPVVQALRLQQLTLLVAALLAASAACVACEYLFLGGAFLALATIKPQLSWPLLVWLLLWVFGNWRKRKSFLLGFTVVMTSLLIASEVVLPGWVQMFIHAVGEYRRYAQDESVIEIALGLVPVASSSAIHAIAQLFALVAVILCAPALWRLRKHEANTSEFGYAISLTLALAVLVVPKYAPYNQVLLLPAIFLLVRDYGALTVFGHRLAYWASGAMLIWQWIASLILCLIFILVSPQRALDAWTLPLLPTLALPIWIFLLMLLRAKGSLSSNPALPAPKGVL
jgi:hypothetical protein